MATIRRINAPAEKEMPKLKVAAYARVSMESEQLLHSLSAQVSHYSKLIQERPDWIYAGVYADEGISGRSTDKRDEFNRMVTDCEDGLIDLVLTKSVSRFARNTVDCLNTVRHLKDLGVEVRFEREGISSMSADGELMLTLLASFAQAESDSISENIKWATRKRFKEGIPNGHKSVYGYCWDGEEYLTIPEEAKVVKRIFREYLEGNPAYTIAKGLAADGIVTQSGMLFSDDAVKFIISNPSYTGTMILQKNYFSAGGVRKQNKGELPRYAVDDMFEQLVSPDDFLKAQEIRRKRAESAPNRNPKLTVFSGVIRCGECGHSMSRRTRKDQKTWRCNRAERKGRDACSSRFITEKELVETACRAIGTDPLDEQKFRREIKRVTVYGDRVEFLTFSNHRKKIPRRYGYGTQRTGFSERIVCGCCGAKWVRETWKRRNEGVITRVKYWNCRNPGCSCKPAKLAESELRKATETFLGTENSEQAFVEYVSSATVYDDRVDFNFKDGTVKTWQRE